MGPLPSQWGGGLQGGGIACHVVSSGVWGKLSLGNQLLPGKKKYKKKREGWESV